MLQRPRRNRKSSAIRSLCKETHLHLSDFIVPFFVLKGEGKKEFNKDLPGICKLSKDKLLEEAKILYEKGVQGILLFPGDAFKDDTGSEALSKEGAVPMAVSLLKKHLPSLCIFCDVALDPYTSHGHDGVINEEGEILNDETIELLTKMSLTLAKSGADFVAPSDMMDGRVEAIRKTLDANGYKNTGIISYTAKYASSLYGPFRDTLGSNLLKGDKKTYQMDPCNRREALREALLDEKEGADGLIVKPALFYLDIVSDIKKNTSLPLFAYHVSGEYAMILSAHEKGYLNAKKAFTEAFLSMKRAGADIIITYALNEVLEEISS